jgi:hypothetical protein
MRRAINLGTERADITIAHVINEDEDEVWFIGPLDGERDEGKKSQ